MCLTVLGHYALIGWLQKEFKELANNYDFITTTNKFGHGISYTKLQELFSEVAYAKIEAIKEKIALFEFCNQESPTILVEHNKDCLEETLSSKWLVLHLTLSWQRPLLDRKQSIDLFRKSMDWFLYDNGLRH